MGSLVSIGCLRRSFLDKGGGKPTGNRYLILTSLNRQYLVMHERMQPMRDVAEAAPAATAAAAVGKRPFGPRIPKSQVFCRYETS